MHQTFKSALAHGWSAVQKYVDGDEITKSDFESSFAKGSGGTWDYDGEHGEKSIDVLKNIHIYIAFLNQSSCCLRTL